MKINGDCMKKLDLKLQDLERILSSLGDSIEGCRDKKSCHYEIYRDAAIKRFTLSFDIFWKFVSLYLREVKKIKLDIVRPKPVFVEAFEQKIISAQERDLCMDLIDARNLTSYAYEENLAEEILVKLEGFFIFMRSVAERLKRLS